MRRRRCVVITVLAALILAGCGRSTSEVASSVRPETSVAVAASTIAPGDGSAPVATVEFVAEVWADNWFALFANGVLVGEDSTAFKTERSFNADTIVFRATYPLTIALVARDYIEDDSGLEYIGTSRQQMGDGGIIAQVTERTSGRLVTATASTWRGMVVHRAPLDTGCIGAKHPATACRSEITVEPTGWTAAAFDDAGWWSAKTYTPQQVGTKDGYTTIRWNDAAVLVWSNDLKADNTILLRAPTVSAAAR